MPLMPKRVKYRKSQRGVVKGNANRGNTVAYGDFGLQAVEGGWLSAEAIEAGRIIHSGLPTGQDQFPSLPGEDFTAGAIQPAPGQVPRFETLYVLFFESLSARLQGLYPRADAQWVADAITEALRKAPAELSVETDQQKLDFVATIFGRARRHIGHMYRSENRRKHRERVFAETKSHGGARPRWEEKDSRAGARFSDPRASQPWEEALTRSDQDAYAQLCEWFHPLGLACPSCGEKVLQPHRKKTSGVCDYRCPTCRVGFNAWSGTFADGSHLSPSKLLMLLLAWSQGAKPTDLAHALDVSPVTVRAYYTKLNGGSKRR